MGYIMSFIKNTTVHNIFSSNWAYSDTPNALVNMLDSEPLSPISSELSPITDSNDFVGGEPTILPSKLLEKKFDKELKDYQKRKKKYLNEEQKIINLGKKQKDFNDSQDIYDKHREDLNKSDSTNQICGPMDRSIRCQSPHRALTETNLENVVRDICSTDNFPDFLDTSEEKQKFKKLRCDSKMAKKILPSLIKRDKTRDA